MIFLNQNTTYVSVPGNKIGNVFVIIIFMSGVHHCKINSVGVVSQQTIYLNVLFVSGVK